MGFIRCEMVVDSEKRENAEMSLETYYFYVVNSFYIMQKFSLTN